MNGAGGILTGTCYIIVNHSSKEYISAKKVDGYHLKQSEWLGSNDALRLMGLALDHWATNAWRGCDLEWVGLDDDRGYALMEEYEEITEMLVGGYNLRYVVQNPRSKRYHFPALWLFRLWRLHDGTAPFDFSEKVIIDKPKKVKE